jgi:hypothetical protein
MENYPSINHDAELQDIVRFSEVVQRLREDDIREQQNLTNIFMRGRKVGKIPTSSADVAASDKIGDFNYDASYLYILVDNSGATWRRATLGSW